MAHDETMTRANWKKRARIAGREARSRGVFDCALSALVVWRRRHPLRGSLHIDVSTAFYEGWNEAIRDSTTR